MDSVSVKNGDDVTVGDSLFEFRRFPIDSEEMKSVRGRIDEIASEIKVLDIVRADLEEKIKQVSLNNGQVENSFVAFSEPDQTMSSFLNQKLISLQELVLMASERLAIERDHYQKISNEEKNSRLITVKAAQSGKVLLQHAIPGSTIFSDEPILSVLNCQSVSVDLFFEEADIGDIQIGNIVSFSIYGSRDVWKSTVSEHPINIDLLDTKQKFNLPTLPRGHWYRVRATPEANFVVIAQKSNDCLVGRNVVASIPRRNIISLIRTIVP